MKNNAIPILGLIGVLLVIVMASGCTSQNNTTTPFENSWMKVQISNGWEAKNVDDRVFISTTNKESGSTIIIGKDTSTKTEPLEDRAKDFSTSSDGNSIKVFKNEQITISGVPGIYIISQYPEKIRPFEGSDVKIGYVLFDKNGKRYIINSQEQYPNIFDSTVEPALNTVIKTLEIKT